MKERRKELQEEPDIVPREPTRLLPGPWPFPHSVVRGRLVRNKQVSEAVPKTPHKKQPPTDWD